MILLDTVAVLRLVLGADLRPEAAVAIRRAQIASALLVSTITAWEIDTLARRTGKTSAIFGDDPRRWITTALGNIAATMIAFDAEDAMALFDLPDMHADPADRMLVATARRRGIPLVTDDSKLIALAQAGYLEMIAC